MGNEAVGKTSMHSVIFASCPAKDTHKLGYTVSRSETQIRLLDNLIMSLWDCPGQKKFMMEYLTSARETVFTNVRILIYVFDLSD
jgi:Ras-related GTP-binding protein A/B